MYSALPLFRLSVALSFLALAGSSFATQLSLDHPCAGLVKKYLESVVAQDWKTASVMLLPSSLERKQKETIAIIKTAPTMTEEAQMLERFGVKEIRDLEVLTPQEFYITDREAWHKRVNAAPEVTSKKKDTLKIDVLGLVEEKDKQYVHATVRTSQETLTDRIEELFLISFVKEGDKWVIWPEMKDRPIITPLDGAKTDAAKK
ncbi:hypothetical protein WJU23_18535 [Prosthecobacter sp. SYSU 5D2]|uniref:hypothetical protein n=1 Tax=Prosthecobacter sp. SYSU 5D2 TaxID=3134134 RepID=UPI0031FE5A72